VYRDSAASAIDAHPGMAHFDTPDDSMGLEYHSFQVQQSISKLFGALRWHIMVDTWRRRGKLQAAVEPRNSKHVRSAVIGTPTMGLT
jgi:hypothetical protein